MVDASKDPLDIAADLAERERQYRLDIQLARGRAPKEAPDEDGQGNRYCLDCAEIIPPERAKAVLAVRCVTCAERQEMKSGRCRQRGGIRQYLTDDSVFSGGKYNE